MGYSPSQAQDYKKLHEQAVVVDTHNDVLINILKGLDIADNLKGKTHSDLTRFKEGGVDVQIFSVWSDGSYGKGKGFAYANRQIDSLYAVVARNPDKMVLAKTPAEVMQAVQQQKLAALIGVEGGHMIEDNLGYLDSLYNRGARYMTLTWNNSTSWATSALDESSGKIPNSAKGLNGFGRQVVRRMNELGMLVDLSHAGEQTFWDVIATTSKPVLVSHSCVKAINPHFRNLTDEQIRAVGKNGGVIHVNFDAGFVDPGFGKRRQQFISRHQAEIDSLRQLDWADAAINTLVTKKYATEMDKTRPPLSLLLDHFDHIVQLVGVDHVGLGSDFDGISATPQQLDGVQDFPVITKELLARGYSEADVRKILGENFLRLFRENVKS